MTLGITRKPRITPCLRVTTSIGYDVGILEAIVHLITPLTYLIIPLTYTAGNQRMIWDWSQPVLLAVLDEAWKGALSVKSCVYNGMRPSGKASSKGSLECALS